jgi:hypothetical protein
LNEIVCFVLWKLVERRSIQARFGWMAHA